MKRIRILATSDVHGYIFPYSYADGMNANIGFGRIKTMIDSLRDENTLILDNGDVLEGSPLMFYHYTDHPDDVSPVTTVMNEIGYDYVNVGNHDFNYGEEALMMHLQNLKAPCITNNWLFHGKPYGPTYVLREINGVRIALFGLTTKYIPHWEKKDHIAHSRFVDAVEAARRTVDCIRRLENPDYVVCMYHGGFERDLQTGETTEDLTGENQAYQMIREVAGIDIMISGHQHRSLQGKLFNTYYTQTSANGAQLACIDIYPEIHNIEINLLDCDAKADEDMLKRVQKEEDECQKWLDTPLGTTTMDLTITDENEARLHKSQVVTFLNKVTMDFTGADLAANALFLHAKGFNKNITMRDLVSTYVFPNTIVVKKVTGKILKEYLEKDAEFFTLKAGGSIGVNPLYDYPKPQHYNYDMLDGISYTIHVANDPGERISDLMRNGKPVQDDDEFTLAINNYRAAGGGNYDMLKRAPVVKEYSESMVEILAKYIMEHKVISFEPVHNITVTL